MSTAVSNDIRITAEPRYERSQSDPRGARYLFSYRITITNTGRDTVQLLHRHWFIRDSLSPMHEVDGPGVIGQTPVLRPGQEFTYTSAWSYAVHSAYEGWYLMERTGDGYQFKVTIPEMNWGFRSRRTERLDPVTFMCCDSRLFVPLYRTNVRTVIHPYCSILRSSNFMIF